MVQISRSSLRLVVTIRAFFDTEASWCISIGDPCKRHYVIDQKWLRAIREGFEKLCRWMTTASKHDRLTVTGVAEGLEGLEGVDLHRGLGPVGALRHLRHGVLRLVGSGRIGWFDVSEA